MSAAILAFALGIAWLQTQAVLPLPAMLLASGAGGLLLLLGALRWAQGRRLLLIPGAFLLGFAWAGLLAQGRLAEALPAASEGVDMQISGVVAALPQAFDQGWRFDFDVEQAALPVPRHISLAWYRNGLIDADSDEVRPQPLRAGERWRFTVRLKRPHGNLNPQGFDFEAWLFEQGIRATGYVRPRRNA